MGQSQTKPKRENHPLTACQITQQFDPKYFIGWTDDEKKAVKDKDIQQIASIFVKRAYDKGYAVEECHIIDHNKDQQEVWDDTVNRYVIEMKVEHFHLLMKFVKVNGKILSGTLPELSVAFGIEPQYIEKPERGRFAYDNMLAYLIHIKYENKAQYDPKDVFTTGVMKDGKPAYKQYMDYYRERKAEWEKGRATVKIKNANLGIDRLEEMVLLGEVTKNQVLLTDEYFNIYAHNKRRVDDAFDTYANRKVAHTIQAMENGEFKLSVLYIQGKSHAGKSMFTDYLVKKLRKDVKESMGEDWAVCSVAASNPFDEYLGEEILVMDDLRGMALSASDWLKLLDPDRISTGSARYRNKKMACRAIFINSERDPVDFFFYIKGVGGGDRGESLDQFFRRILALVTVYRVPDDLDTRRIGVGEMQETNRYLIDKPGSARYNGDSEAYEHLMLHHDFQKNVQDLSYDEAQDYLSAMILSRNGLKTDIVEDGVFTPEGT